MDGTLVCSFGSTIVCTEESGFSLFGFSDDMTIKLPKFPIFLLIGFLKVPNKFKYDVGFDFSKFLGVQFSMLFWVCQILVFLTGFTGLVYQVTWQKYLSNFLGSHASATTIILGVFFLFLTLGYLTLGRISNRIMKNQFLLYGIIEGLIGAYCLISPLYFEWLNRVFSFHVPNEFLRLAVDSFFTCLFIGFPTWLMGATIPVLTEALSGSLTTSHRTHALIYGINTVGAFLGTLICGFFLIEQFGLTITVVMMSFVNLFVAGIAYLLARDNSQVFAVKSFPKSEFEEMLKPKMMTSTKTLYALSFLSGFYFFSFENLFIRLANLSLGSTNYTYSIVVAGFILAIAVGSFIVSRLDSINERNFLYPAFASMLVAFGLLYFLIPKWPMIFLRVRWIFQGSDMNHSLYWMAVLVLLLLLLLIPVGLMGAGLPLLFAYLRRFGVSLNSTVGSLYAINSLGCTLGTFIGGYILYNFVSISAIYKINLFLIAISLLLLVYAVSTKHRYVYIVFSLVSILFAVLVPGWNENSFAPGVYLSTTPPAPFRPFSDNWHKVKEKLNRGEIIFTQHDPNTSVHVQKFADGNLALFVNGKPDAVTNSDHIVRSMTPLVPLSIAREIKNVFIVGLGGGLSTAISAGFKENERVTVAEISKGVISAQSLFEKFNNLVPNRHKVDIVNGDAFKVLRQQKNLFDVIICEPSNPWVTGVDKLYTYDFLKLVRDKLTPNGVFSQWFLTAGINTESFRRILRTYNSVFPWTSVWVTGGLAVAIIGSKTEPVLDFRKMESRFQERNELYKSLGFNHYLSLLSLQSLPPLSVYAVSRDINTMYELSHPRLSYEAGRAFFAVQTVYLDSLLSTFLTEPYPPNSRGSRFLYEDYRDIIKKSPPVEFYRDGIAFLGRWWQIEFMYNRLNYEKSLYFPNSGTSQERESSLRIKALLDSSASNPVLKEYKDPKRLQTVYQALITMHLSPNKKTVSGLLPKKCETLDCVNFKNHLMNDKKLSLNQNSQLNSPEVQEVERLFETTR